MTILCLVRHAQSIGNQNGFYSGYTEGHHGLTERGFEQAERCGEKLSEMEFTKMWSSKLDRAVQTAQIIRMRSLSPVSFWVTTEHLNERHYGELGGLSRTHALELYGEEIVNRWSTTITQKPPGGESIQQVSQRARQYYRKNIEPFLGENNILIVSHMQILRGLVSYIEEIPLEDTLKTKINNAEPIIYEF